jgi:hypothetical protein
MKETASVYWGFAAAFDFSVISLIIIILLLYIIIISRFFNARFCTIGDFPSLDLSSEGMPLIKLSVHGIAGRKGLNSARRLFESCSRQSFLQAEVPYATCVTSVGARSDLCRGYPANTVHTLQVKLTQTLASGAGIDVHYTSHTHGTHTQFC